MKEVILGISVAAACFGGYQLIARSAGQTNSFGALVIVAASLIPMVAMLMWRGAEMPVTSSLTRLALAGIVMGIGFSVNILLVTHPRVEISTTMTAVAALVVCIAAIGGMVFFREPLPARKILGIVLAITAIILLRPAPSPTTLNSADIEAAQENE